MEPMDIAVIGAGRVGTAVAVLLQRAGHRIVAVSGRGQETDERAARYLPGTPVLPAAEAARRAEVVLVATPDAAIGETCSELVRTGAIGPRQAVVHLSGAVSLGSLDAAAAAGATVMSVHPLQTFPDVEAALARLAGAGVAITATTEEGHRLGERLALDLRGRPFRLADGAKPLYHAAAVFASNYLVAVTAVALEALRTAGLPDPVGMSMPLQRATLENVATMGPEAALTGPAVRGDAETVARNLEALATHAPSAVPAYVALADVVLDLGERSGRLSADGRLAVEEVLSRWR